MRYILFDNDFYFFDPETFSFHIFYDTYYFTFPPQMICCLSAFYCYLLNFLFNEKSKKLRNFSFPEPFGWREKMKLKLMNLSKGIKVDPLYLYASLCCFIFLHGKGDTLTSDSLYCYSIKTLSRHPISPRFRRHTGKSAKLKFYGAKERAQKIAFNWCECVIKKRKRKGSENVKETILHCSLT